jgi:hypothetical protein
MRDALSALYMSEQIAGETWQIQRYSYDSTRANAWPETPPRS